MIVSQANCAPVSDAAFSKHDLVSKTWAFVTPGQGVVSPYCKFLASGYVSGVPNQEACWWKFEVNELILINAEGVLAIVFDRFSLGLQGNLCLHGRSLSDPDAMYILNERDPISALAEASTDAVLIKKEGQRRRRNLVVVRANENSCHPSWPIDICAADRTWDLCTSFYGDVSSFPFNDFAEYQVLQNKERKWPAIHKLFHKDSPLWNYDYYLFPDDDIEMSWSSINRIFEVSRSFGLNLAQPALATGSYFSYKITLQKARFNMRYTNYVEAMTPLFSRFAMEVCAPTFAASQSGWGLDYIWAHLLGNLSTSIAIIDEVSVLHRRPVGNSYDTEIARAEMFRVMAKFGAPVSQATFGGVLPSGWRVVSKQAIDNVIGT